MVSRYMISENECLGYLKLMLDMSLKMRVLFANYFLFTVEIPNLMPMIFSRFQVNL